MKRFENDYLFFLLNLLFTVIVLFLTKFIDENLIITTLLSIFCFLIISAYLIRSKKYAYILFISYFITQVSHIFLTSKTST